MIYQELSTNKLRLDELNNDKIVKPEIFLNLVVITHSIV